MPKVKRGLAVVLVGLFLGGCGYTTRSLVTAQYTRIYIPQFANKINITQDADSQSKYRINKPLLETDITKSVVNRFIFDGNLKVSKSEYADVALKGELLEFRRDPLRYTNSEDVEEYRLSIVVKIILWDQKADKALWEENNFTGDTTYFVTGANAKSEATAINDAITDLSRRIVERVVEQW